MLCTDLRERISFRKKLGVWLQVLPSFHSLRTEKSKWAHTVTSFKAHTNPYLPLYIFIPTSVINPRCLNKDLLIDWNRFPFGWHGSLTFWMCHVCCAGRGTTKKSKLLTFGCKCGSSSQRAARAAHGSQCMLAMISWQAEQELAASSIIFIFLVWVPSFVSLK